LGSACSFTFPTAVPKKQRSKHVFHYKNSTRQESLQQNKYHRNGALYQGIQEKLVTGLY